MCGIAGVWGRADEPLVEAMMEQLRHRGPDAAGKHLHGHCGVLGHRRLSIMDPSGGDQPLYDETRTKALVANGEVYNYPKLRQELAPRHSFATGNDSEAVLHLVEEQGPGAIARLDGMFALAVAADDGLLLARDPLGIKPLYCGSQQLADGGRQLVFASELKALAGRADELREFPPGSVYTSAAGLRTYYQVPRRRPLADPVAVHVGRIRQVLEEAVGKRLMSDVPVGAFLSGGLDSSIIAALVRRQMDQLHTFSVGVAGSRDLAAARLVARHIDSVHHEYVYTPEEVLAQLPEVIYHLESFDQDLVRSAIPCHFCSRLAAQHVKVILTGEGADELFAGYAYYHDFTDADALHAELHRSVRGLHNTNLQRVDRLTMAHGLEGRVPFLDLQLVELGQTVPTALKLRPDGDGRRVEKWVLRQAAADLLPPEIVWREKEQFDEGSGTVDLLATLGAHLGAGIDLGAYSARFPEDGLRSVEECAYHRVLHEVFDHPRAVARNVARWAQRQG